MMRRSVWFSVGLTVLVLLVAGTLGRDPQRISKLARPLPVSDLTHPPLAFVAGASVLGLLAVFAWLSHRMVRRPDPAGSRGPRDAVPAVARQPVSQIARRKRMAQDAVRTLMRPSMEMATRRGSGGRSFRLRSVLSSPPARPRSGPKRRTDYAQVS